MIVVRTNNNCLIGELWVATTNISDYIYPMRESMDRGVERMFGKSVWLQITISAKRLQFDPFEFRCDIIRSFFSTGLSRPAAFEGIAGEDRNTFSYVAGRYVGGRLYLRTYACGAKEN